MLDIYDMQLVSYGRELIHYRNDFIDQMNGIIRDIHFNLSGGKRRAGDTLLNKYGGRRTGKGS